MKLSALALFILFVCGLPAALCAQTEPMVRIDIAGHAKDELDIEITAASDGAKYGRSDRAGRQWYIQFPATSAWQKGSVTIFPSADGRITIDPMGQHVVIDAQVRLLKPVFAHFDAMVISTMELKNGGFELTEDADRPAYWYPIDQPNSNPPITPENMAAVRTGDAAEGRRYLRVWHNSRVGQIIKVQGGVPVTLMFQYRVEE